MEKALLLLLLISMMWSCNGQRSTSSDDYSLQEPDSLEVANYSIDSLPIYIESIDDKLRKKINELYERDTSSYGIDSRPIIFQIRDIRSGQDETRYTLRINRDVQVLIYAQGEAQDSVLVDYGWIENDKGDVIWKMKFEETEYAGGSKRNRKLSQYFTIPKGTYRLRYKSNATHAIGDWIGEKPEHSGYYGITVFNLKAIQRINTMKNDSE